MDTQAITIRLPREVYDDLRLEAFETRRPMNAIITDSLRQRTGNISAEQYGQLCGLFEAAWHHDVPDSLDDVLPMTSAEARKLAILAEEVIR